ncbi:MAG TPA: lysophospholipid acyltransferase family protein [Polyangiaceae bacterium]|nr:lysophospholipid acyltransferase family protein [Polyangiaceae bacterium]
MNEKALPRREQSALLRRLAHWGALEGPQALLRFGPRPIGAAFGLALPDVRRRIVSNLRRVHGRRGALREQLDALSTLANYAACFAEAMAASREGAAPRVKVTGESLLREALGRGGVVLVTAHVGPWEMTAQLLGQELSADVVLVMEPEPNAAAGELQDRWRSERGLRMLHIGAHPTDALPLIAHLKQGGVVALQMDRLPPSGRVLSVTLFGEPFEVPEGPFRLAALSAAQVVPVFSRRTGFFEYELAVAEPIGLGRRPKADELQAAAQSAADAMQGFVQQSPTQWFHFQAR